MNAIRFTSISFSQMMDFTAEVYNQACIQSDRLFKAVESVSTSPDAIRRYRAILRICGQILLILAAVISWIGIVMIEAGTTQPIAKPTVAIVSLAQVEIAVEVTVETPIEPIEVDIDQCVETTKAFLISDSVQTKTQLGGKRSKSTRTRSPEAKARSRKSTASSK